MLMARGRKHWGSGPGSRRQRVASSHPYGLTVACALVLVALALLISARYAAIADKGYELAAARARLAELESTNQYLKLQVARLSDPKRLEQIARARLGLVHPDSREVLVAAVPSVSFDELIPVTATPATVAGDMGMLDRFSEFVVTWFVGGRTAEARSPQR